MELVEITEGKTTVLIPVQDDTTQFPPGSAPIFFNRRMELNRDVTILLLSILQPSDYLDAMGATGIRGIRVATECGIPVTISDREPSAINLIRKNTERSGLAIKVIERDANALLSEQSFDAVDLDPFGTPAWVIDAAIRGTRRFLFVTATDTAPLCGAHLKAGIRRYGAEPMNTEYHSEVGLRILLGFVVRETVKYDRGIEPVFCYAREHFTRLHLRILRGAKAADETLSHIGFIHQCKKCPYREEQAGLHTVSITCPLCGEPLHPIGPLWLGSIQRDGITKELKTLADTHEPGSKKDLLKLLDACEEELPTSSFYDYHVLAKRLGCSPPAISVVLERIRAGGYAVSRTHFSGYGIKTDAPLEIVFDAISAQQ
ncbi:MAG: tRNA (guanine(10)-N(2))-dimethyltransferase [Methanomicrobiales archaeon HGW-Methanomicrobiales-3]|jgi:tRNA (guanine26-N2/guanine27-N2)-dimethyltransferase|nr:MAG: tRNA (guanine(10)-N(2))-dimethyltransferase [Methanomicrobiales archaeon HGW-Methanomicrobiales-3]